MSRILQFQVRVQLPAVHCAACLVLEGETTLRIPLVYLQAMRYRKPRLIVPAAGVPQMYGELHELRHQQNEGREESIHLWQNQLIFEKSLQHPSFSVFEDNQ